MIASSPKPRTTPRYYRSEPCPPPSRTSNEIPSSLERIAHAFRVFRWLGAGPSQCEGLLDGADWPVLLAAVETWVPTGASERDFVGDLFIALVHDDGQRFALLTQGDLAGLGSTEDAAFELGTKNLASLLDAGLVRAHAAGAGVAIIAGGNFEASLLLVPSMWTWVCEHLRATRLLAALPARDLVMVVDADDARGRADLAAFVARTADLTRDHRLSNLVFVWDGTCWAEHRVSESRS